VIVINRALAGVAGLALAAAAAVVLADQPAPKWRMQYFYDEDKSTFHIVDLQFPSARRGIAVGIVVDGAHQKSAAVLTSDGGAHWQMSNLEEQPVSLYFLNEGLGWMVTTKGLWQTTELGKNWRKLPRLPGPVYRVYFTDEKTGFAAGPKKKVYQTHDAGQHWDEVKAAADPPGNPEFSGYTWISFATAQFGIITGWNMPPPRGQRLPDWIDPEEASNRRDVPHLSYSLVTNDGGQNWKASSASLFGQVTRVRFGPAGFGLGLIEYSGSFRYAAEAYRIDWKTGKSETVYRDRKFAVSDIWLTADGGAYLAGVQSVGQIRGVVPGKVMVLHSSGPELTAWSEMPVDYRATANRVLLAVPDPQNLWLATDGGMILKLQ
jgi:photosystem II stability/assembly factor-like uncharacterized protein